MSSVDDSETMAQQIGRPLRAASRVVSRCNLGLPVVAEVPPLLETGEPFPTRYWLTCPLAHRRIARLEAAGGVRELQARVDSDPLFATALADAHERYAKERDASLPTAARHIPRGGVGGASGGIKCLHAHYADYMAGNDNPVGAEVQRRIGAPRCEIPCVSQAEAGAQRNPGWREPTGEEG